MNHIMLDAYGGNERRLDDMKTVNAVLNEIAFTLHLTAVMPPFLLPYYYAKESDDDGISAFTILEGGHLTIHTFPRRGCLFLDLLYDGYYDENKLISLLKAVFLLADVKSVRTERRLIDTTIPRDRIYLGGGAEYDFGPHTIARAENVDVSFEEIFDMLDEIPLRIGMVPICRPYLLKSSLREPHYLSGIVLIAQSHIAFHYDIAERTLFCDAFSCSFYKSENFVEYLKDKFGKISHMTVIRGSKHTNKIRSRETAAGMCGEWIKNYTRRP